ncbi:MAG: hypothetical protein AB2531_12890 [Candidatus Thiodiazotropha sp.]
MQKWRQMQQKKGRYEEEMILMAVEGCIHLEWRGLPILGMFSSACALLLMLTGARMAPKGECPHTLFPAAVGTMISMVGLLVLTSFLFIRTPAQRWPAMDWRNILYALFTLVALGWLVFFTARPPPPLTRQEPAAELLVHQRSPFGRFTANCGGDGGYLHCVLHDMELSALVLAS